MWDWHRFSFCSLLLSLKYINLQAVTSHCTLFYYYYWPLFSCWTLICDNSKTAKGKKGTEGLDFGQKQVLFYWLKSRVVVDLTYLRCTSMMLNFSILSVEWIYSKVSNQKRTRGGNICTQTSWPVGEIKTCGINLIIILPAPKRLSNEGFETHVALLQEHLDNSAANRKSTTSYNVLVVNIINL